MRQKGARGFFDAEQPEYNTKAETELERKAGERGDRGPGEHQHFAKWILGFAGRALAPAVTHGDLRIPGPGDHAAQEAVGLGHGGEAVAELAGEKPEIAGIDRQLSLRQQPHDTVEGP